MPVGRGDEMDEAERLKELGHLSAAVGHHVINAFSAVVSNAELIRSHAKSPNCDLNELAALGGAIIENALERLPCPPTTDRLDPALHLARFRSDRGSGRPDRPQ